MDLASRKRALRERMAVLPAAWGADFSRRLGEAAADHLVRTREFAAAKRIALFAALPDELDTGPLLARIRGAGKAALLPRCRSDVRLDFVGVERWDELVAGRYGLREPAPDRPAEALGAGDLALLPGVAFDPAGHRLGRGRGYYDRTLADAPPGAPVLFGWAADHRVVERVPVGPDDRGVDAVVTEAGVLRPGGSAERP